jgi:hypothetical protein
MRRAASCYSTVLNRIKNKLGNGVEKFTKPESFGKTIENEAKYSTCGFAPQIVAPEHASPCGRAVGQLKAHSALDVSGRTRRRVREDAQIDSKRDE